MNRQPELRRERNQNPSLGGPVQFGHHETGDLRHRTKGLHLRNRVLPRGRIKHKQDVVRGLAVQFPDDANDLRQFLHEVLPVLKAPRRIDEQDVGAVLGRGLHGAEGKCRGVGTLGRRQNGHACPFAPDLQLLDRGGPERVAGRDCHPLARGAELAGKLADCGGLAGTVDPDDEDDLQPTGENRQRSCDRLKDPFNLLGQHSLDFRCGHPVPEPPLRHIGNHGGGQIHTHVRGNEQILQILEHVIVEAPAGNPRTGAHGIGQAPKHAAGPGFARITFAARRPFTVTRVDEFVDARLKPVGGAAEPLLQFREKGHLLKGGPTCGSFRKGGIGTATDVAAVASGESP